MRWLTKMLAVGSLSLFLATTSKVNAATDATSEAATFTIRPQLPTDNIGGSSLGYFNLQLKAGQVRSESIQIYNPTKQTITVELAVVNGQTETDGRISYQPLTKTNRQLLPQPGSSYVSIPESVKIAAGQAENVPINIHTKKQLFAGTKLAAINIYSAADTSIGAVENRFVYTVGLVLNGKKLVPANLQQLALTKVTLVQKKKLPRSFEFRVVNADPLLIEDGQAQLKLRHQLFGFLNYQVTKKSLKIAPDSSFKLNWDLSGYRLTSGYHQLTFNFKTNDYREQRVRYLLVKQGKAQLVSKKQYQQHQQVSLILAGAITVALIACIITLIKHYQHKKKEVDHDE